LRLSLLFSQDSSSLPGNCSSKSLLVLDEQVVAALSPYVRQHINRFGRYQLDLTQLPLPLNYAIQDITSSSKKKKATGFVATESQKKAKSKRKKKKGTRQMKLF
jgi:hypothetical protein